MFVKSPQDHVSTIVAVIDLPSIDKRMYIQKHVFPLSVD